MPPAETVPPTETAPPAERPWPSVAAARVAGALARRGVGARALGGLAVALASLAAVLFALAYPRLAAGLGILALLASELSLLPPRGEAASSSGLARALAPPVDLLLGAGIVAAAAMATPTAHATVLLGLLVLILLAWLPTLGPLPPAPASADSPGARAGIWRRTERVGLLLLGALLGRLVPALLLVLVVGSVDVWLRIDRLQDDAKGGPAFLRPLLQDDGRLVPAVRWGTLAIALLVLLVLPPAS